MPSAKVAASSADRADKHRQQAADLYNALEQSLEGKEVKKKDMGYGLRNLLQMYFNGLAELREFAAKQKTGS